LLARIPGVCRVGVALVEGGGRQLRFSASDRAGGDDLEWCDVDAYDDLPLNTAVRSGTPVIGSIEELGSRFPDYVDRQHGTATVAVAAVPVVAAGRTLGGYLLLFDRAQPFDRRQRLDLARTGRELGAALRRARGAERSRPAARVEADAPPDGARIASHDVDGDPAAVAVARQFLRRTLADWQVGEELTDDATLCLSELVTNAIIHSYSGCVVRVVLHDGVLTTTVRNWDPAPAPSVAAVADPLQVHGRGLQVVDAVAARWGHRLDPEGASVWFALDVE
jgi:anti-sigma regulatory factor (Ser/Thr protein kinase)